ncbi:PhzF family phenazine biosynthesis protein [Rubripirellula reticaptiva]|uniref:Trans-2,3-dihydro-3-hydroxyanthranilate isomerase n=1 Tax=Rubripirellula reticaptiva TaxID=2528013 RepID=A0A5C6ENT6_9BACT|nr:PhzF family phenazine biosynthesis protein [Rubripirellula reticaptiva]TWU49266.1 Trans-2,3-dihydro-3-hydroxyanthranilate isomerase [Rubripirellula reticaptiva]
MKVPLFQVDAFADRRFSGNPAAVCLLDDEADSEWMQSIASEMNLSETAFVRRVKDEFQLRWFTPAYEVDLCGHATLASAHILWAEGGVKANEPIHFQTRSGVLTCKQDGDLIELNFPATPPAQTEPPPRLLEALGVNTSEYIGQSPFDQFVVVSSEEIVRSLQPDFGKLAEIPMRGVIVTAVSDDPQFDFVSRFFAPSAGVNEDPVTGSAHCCLGPFWQKRLGKSEMMAYQASKRGGAVRVRIDGDRVLLGGKAVTVLKGELV